MNAYILSLRYTRTRTHIKHTLFLNHSLLVEYVSCMRLFAFCVFRNFCNNSFTKQRKKHTFSALNILANHLKRRTVRCAHTYIHQTITNYTDIDVKSFTQVLPVITRVVIVDCSKTKCFTF